MRKKPELTASPVDMSSGWSARMDVLVLMMQTPQAGKGIDRVMNATVGELADALVNYKRDRRGRERRFREVQELLAFASEVLGSPETAKRWMARRCKALDGKAPEFFIHTYRGRDRVRWVLESIREKNRRR